MKSQLLQGNVFLTDPEGFGFVQEAEFVGAALPCCNHIMLTA